MIRRPGFTTIELLISMSVTAVLMIAIWTITITYYGMITRSNIQSGIIVDSQTILRGMVDELRVASSVRTTNQVPDANAPGGGWSTSSASAILIISTPAQDSSRDYIIDTDTGEPYQNEVIYFAEGTTLYKRLLSNASAAGNTAVSTCPEADATSTCPADRVLSEEYQALDFTFYDQDDAVTATPESARSIAMVIRLARQTYGGEVGIDNNIRVTLRN